MQTTRGNLRVDAISKSVGSTNASKMVLRDCSFQVDAGTFTVIIGPSGCGKTTLINLIAGYEAPTKGSMLLDGVEVRGPGPERLVVFQETALFPWMTALENVMYGPTVRGREEKCKIREQALDLLGTVGLGQFAEKYPMQLSGGMQRRCELARALINDPVLLLMDEPFRGLDHMTRELMQEYLLTLLEERQGTIVFVTSEIDEAIYLGDRIIVLGSTPACVKSVIEVDLPRPRKRHDILASAKYAALKQKTIDLLYEEAAGAFTRARPSRVDARGVR
jgi:NitT/TauT family transport system ATP-binding protein